MLVTSNELYNSVILLLLKHRCTFVKTDCEAQIEC